ncbi:MAG: flagellar hook-length control protein FliK [Pseudomonadota bacterium]
MNDMLAILRGVAVQGKGLPGVANATGQAGEPGMPGGDSFTAVLLTRLQGGGLQADGQALAQQLEAGLGAAEPGVAPGALPAGAVLPQLQAADPTQDILLAQGAGIAQVVTPDALQSRPAATLPQSSVADAERAPSLVSAQDAALQAILLAPMAAAPTQAAAPIQPAGAAVAPPVTGGGGEVDGKPAVVATVLAETASASGRAAGNAADGQLLPFARESGDAGKAGGGKGRADLAVTANQAAAQPQALPAVGVVQAGVVTQGPDTVAPAVPSTVSQPGMVHGQPMVAEAQARSSGGVQIAVDAPLRSPQFAQELGERVVWLAGRNGHMAEIALNPSHLGPVEVRLSLSGGEAGVQFFSPHQQVRDALEAALPKLREMLADSGVTLGQTQVREEAFAGREGFARGAGGEAAEQEGHAEQAPHALASLGLTRGGGLGLVDLYV